MTYSYTRSSSFTIAHARQLSSKVAADMHLCALYYGEPSEQRIRDYAEELAQMLNGGFVEEYEFGFKRNEKRVVCWQYVVQDGRFLADGRPGKVFSYADATGAPYYNFMTYSDAWWNLSDRERYDFRAMLPIQRTSGNLPSDGDGYWVSEHGYSAGDVGLTRRTYRPSA
jgi:Bacterial HORMA domain family 1